MACCVLMGASVVVWPQGADSQWTVGWAYVAAAVGWLIPRGRSAVHEADLTVTLALGALGLVVLTLRLSAQALLVQSHVPGGLIIGSTVQAVVGGLVAAAPAGTGARGLAAILRSSEATVRA